MSRLNLLLSIVFGLLLIVTLGEVAYYTLFLTPRGSIKENSLPVESKPNVVTSPTPNPHPGINPNMIRYLQTLDNKQLKSAYFVNVFEGEITNLIAQDDVTSDKEIKRREIDLKQANNHTMIYLFSESPALHIYEKVDGEEKILSFDDLKKGDSVVIKETRTLTTELSSSLIELKIERK